MSAIHKIYEEMNLLLSNQQLETKIYTTLTQLVFLTYKHVSVSDEGYCFKFNLPIQQVMNLYTDIGIKQTDVSNAFIKDWGQRLTVMHKDPYYQILLLLIYYGIKNNKKHIVDNSLMIILMKVWNGRKHTFFKYCDKRVMNYVINNMTSNRHEVTKHASPVNLLKDYFVPSLTEKYSSQINSDVAKLRRLFEQCYSRIYQLFVQNPRYNPTTNRNEAQGGLLPLYMKAKREGLYMQTTLVHSSNDDQTTSFDDYTSMNNRDNIISSVVDKITMNATPQYPNTLIDQINKDTKVSTKNIVKILIDLHNHNNHDILTDIMSIILSRTNIIDKSDICHSQFKTNLKKNIITSKNNTEIKKLQSLLNTLLDNILPKITNTKLNQYSNVHQMQIRNVIIYGLQYHLIKTVCR